MAPLLKLFLLGRESFHLGSRCFKLMLLQMGKIRDIGMNKRIIKGSILLKNLQFRGRNGFRNLCGAVK